MRYVMNLLYCDRCKGKIEHEEDRCKLTLYSGKRHISENSTYGQRVRKPISLKTICKKCMKYCLKGVD